jgi:hypothetical protein
LDFVNGTANTMDPPLSSTSLLVGEIFVMSEIISYSLPGSHTKDTL